VLNFCVGKVEAADETDRAVVARLHKDACPIERRAGSSRWLDEDLIRLDRCQ
jgi:hypothetical protein